MDLEQQFGCGEWEEWGHRGEGIADRSGCRRTRDRQRIVGGHRGGSMVGNVVLCPEVHEVVVAAVGIGCVFGYVVVVDGFGVEIEQLPAELAGAVVAVAVSVLGVWAHPFVVRRTEVVDPKDDHRPL